ncbi:hypothetical protein [Merismopedia glauca]|uniref:Uncharacterized protein n=1 Tax=Merismopedia glauca CCAP 1448/3 TaxID=1296344 RepID=A0A2T1BXV8_9CYAN|nr:hypothetical protein [Merismopedia glauca]PSB00831.1 hypothetical protein C7B64_21400 [Merismopedia glauca CCAP 1448/3]
MVTIEQLMQHGTRRKIETIALEMGYSPANEYPAEVLEEVKRRSSKTKKRKSPTATAQAAAEEQTHTVASEDLQDIDDAAQHRAAAMRVGSDALTLYYYATGQFTNPELKNQVEDSRSKLKEAMRGIAAAYDPEFFLAQTRLMELTTGRNGQLSELSD